MRRGLRFKLTLRSLRTGKKPLQMTRYNKQPQTFAGQFPQILLKFHILASLLR